MRVNSTRYHWLIDWCMSVCEVANTKLHHYTAIICSTWVPVVFLISTNTYLHSPLHSMPALVDAVLLLCDTHAYTVAMLCFCVLLFTICELCASSPHSSEDPTNVTLEDFKRYIHQFPQSELKTALHFSILDIDTHEPFT